MSNLIKGVVTAIKAAISPPIPLTGEEIINEIMMYKKSRSCDDLPHEIPNHHRHSRSLEGKDEKIFKHRNSFDDQIVLENSKLLKIQIQRLQRQHAQDYLFDYKEYKLEVSSISKFKFGDVDTSYNPNSDRKLKKYLMTCLATMNFSDETVLMKIVSKYTKKDQKFDDKLLKNLSKTWRFGQKYKDLVEKYKFQKNLKILEFLEEAAKVIEEMEKAQAEKLV